MSQKIKLKKEPSFATRFQAFPYQIEVVNAIKDLEYAGIFLEQGLGKSKIAIDLILYWLGKKQVDTVLLVVKKSLIFNWEKELTQHAFITPRQLTQNKKANYYVFNSPARLMLAHYEVLRSEIERFKLFLRTRNVAVILDESSKIKNPSSTISESLFELGPLFTKRVIMTGTPVANRPYDIWAQIYFLDRGKSLGKDFQSFRSESDLSNDLHSDALKRSAFEKCLNTLHGRIANFTVRMTKDSGVIELPRKIIHEILSDWEPRQYDLYCQVRDEMRAIVIRNGIPTEDNAEELLKRMLRLVQVASNPHLIDDAYNLEPGKVINLEDIVSKAIAAKEKCIVWTTFIENADWLAKRLQRFGSRKVHGKLSILERKSAINKFIENENIRVLIATPGAAKEGLTLTVANHVIFYDRSFSLDDYLQAQDRVHRISQKKTCHVHNIMMRDSIDEWIDMLIKSKQLAAQLVQGDITREFYSQHISYAFGSAIRQILQISEDHKSRGHKHDAEA